MVAVGVAPPPVVPLEALSDASRGFYAENRRVTNLRARRVLGWAPRFRDYQKGLQGVWDEEGKMRGS